MNEARAAERGAGGTGRMNGRHRVRPVDRRARPSGRRRSLPGARDGWHNRGVRELARHVIRRLRGQPRLLPPRVDVEIRDVEYQPGVLARVYGPRAGSAIAAVVDVHGGNWTSGDR